MTKKLRLILGDQLNSKHSWYENTNDLVCYVLMEIRSETDYVTHHIQKIAGFFAAMRNFATELQSKGHQVIYLTICQEDNLQSLEKNLLQIITNENITHFEYQLPDEYRLDVQLQNFCNSLSIPSSVVDSEHFLSTREELGLFFKDKKTFLMESFYREMRKKHHILMQGDKPLTGKWNYDIENRKKLPAHHKPTAPLLFSNDVSTIIAQITNTTIATLGTINAKNFLWPINRKQSLELLEFFTTECLAYFGSYQDAMTPNEWSMYHSRLSFAMNCKLITPLEVIQRAITEWKNNPEKIAFHQLEGFVRQIIGWREYMRGIYWDKMPEYANRNYFQNENPLPEWFWTGKTKMHCLKDAITQSLQFAYAHHIQRLMVTGNFALLAGVHPDAVDAWYLGIYIDAIEWVEITNTRGMSQFADGGIVGTKPYVSSAAYIDKMSHYCGSCFYKKALKTGEKACPFNSLYWNFYDKNEAKLSKNPRIGMMYNVWRKMKPEDKANILKQADYYLKNINTL